MMMEGHILLTEEFQIISLQRIKEIENVPRIAQQ